MAKLLKEYVNIKKPEGKFLGMSFSKGVLKVSFDTHTDIVTMENNNLKIRTM